MQNPEGSFLHDRNPQMHASREVEAVVDFLRSNEEGAEHIPNEPADKISAYLGFLANHEYVNDGILTGDQASIDRQVDAHVIEAENVPEGYFELQRRLARERGRGDIQITPEMRQQMIEAVQADQRAGLDKWVEYLGGDDGGYPDWFKYYVWTSVIKLGTFDKEKQEFRKRSRGTTAPYPELNREALAYVYDTLNKFRIQGEAVDDEKLRNLLQGGNFGKLYAHAVLEVTPDSPELRNETKGSWTKFSQTSDPRTARRLAGSLQGHGTGWCTAGESTASTQLQYGDFYVYYTRDEDGKDTVPRVAIRMERGQVAEVRGVNAAQELEPEMADITTDQLMDLPGGDRYAKKAEDMKQLTVLEKKITANPDIELTSDELRFLYEMDHAIQGFGYTDDPRASEIRALRGDRDKPELIRVIAESIREQVQTAYTAYTTVTKELSGTRRRFRKAEAIIPQATVEQMFATKDKEWQTNGTYDYMIKQLVENGARHHLVITPNIGVTKKQLLALAESFGEQQPRPTRVRGDMYRRSKHTPREWSGNHGNEPVLFSLISSKCDEDFNSLRKPDEQMHLLEEKQVQRPELKFRVPSPLTSVSYWYALRASGDKLDDPGTFVRTRIRHIDMKPTRVYGTRAHGWLYVPDSSIFHEGGPVLGSSSVIHHEPVRLAVG